MKRSDWRVVVAGIGLLAMTTEICGLTIRTVAITGQILPGAESEVFTGAQRLPVIDALGSVSFVGSVADPNDHFMHRLGIWTERNGSLTLVALAGTPAVDVPGDLNYGSTASPLFEPVFNSRGEVAFVGRLVGAGVNDFNNSGIWWNDVSETRLVMRESEPVAGAPAGVKVGSSFSFGFNQMVFSNSGTLSFVADISGSSDPLVTEGIWTLRDGAVALTARDGIRAPGTPSGAVFGSPFPDMPSTATKSLTFTDLSMNHAGQIAFVARLRGSGVNDANRNGIWKADEDLVDLVVRSGTQAPGTSAETSFRAFFGLALDPTGRIAFAANLIGGGVSASNDSGVWWDRDGAISLFRRTGDFAPEISPTARFTGFNSNTLVFNGAGNLAFNAVFAGPGISSANDTAILTTDGEALKVVAREGSPAPGAGNGVLFGQFGDDSGPVFNRLGQTAFLSRLTGSTVNSTNDRGVFATDLSGALHLIARAGDFLEVAPGDLRQISFLNFAGWSGISGGQAAGFNDMGQVVLTATFRDGTHGIFVSNLVAIPEPEAVFLMAIAAIACGLRPRGLAYRD